MKIVRYAAGFMLGMLILTSYAKAEGVETTVVDRVQSETENKLGLNQDQRDKLKALKEKFRAEQKVVADALKVKRDALRVELDGPNPDRKKVDGIAADITKLSGQAVTHRIDQIFSIRALLTTEQYQKLRELLEEKREKAKAKVPEKKVDTSAVKGKKAKKK